MVPTLAATDGVTAGTLIGAAAIFKPVAALLTGTAAMGATTVAAVVVLGGTANREAAPPIGLVNLNVPPEELETGAPPPKTDGAWLDGAAKLTNAEPFPGVEGAPI